MQKALIINFTFSFLCNATYSHQKQLELLENYINPLQRQAPQWPYCIVVSCTPINFTYFYTTTLSFKLLIIMKLVWKLVFSRYSIPFFYMCICLCVQMCALVHTTVFIYGNVHWYIPQCLHTSVHQYIL